MESEKLFYVGIKALIYDTGDQILLLKADVTKHRKNTESYWDIPGGRIKEGDSALATLQREVLEETGVAVNPEVQFLTSVISNHEIPMDSGGVAGLVLMVYRATIPAGSQIKLSEEHTAFEWVSRAEAAKRLSHKYPPVFTASL